MPACASAMVWFFWHSGCWTFNLWCPWEDRH